jgi:hypothetical protein
MDFALRVMVHFTLKSVTKKRLALMNKNLKSLKIALKYVFLNDENNFQMKNHSFPVRLKWPGIITPGHIFK